MMLRNTGRNRRSLISGIATGFLALTSAFTTPAFAAGENQARVTVVNIDKTVHPMQAVQAVKKFADISKTRGPVFIVGYDSRLQDQKITGASDEATQATKVSQEMYKDAMVLALNGKQREHGKYPELLMVIDLAYHGELNLGWGFRTEPNGPLSMPWALGTAFVNGDRVRMKGTPFIAKNSSGKEIGKALEGIIVLQPVKDENARQFRNRLFGEFEKLYDTASAQFVPPPAQQ